MSATDVLNQVRLVQEIMSAAMKDGEHYGKIPGCGSKPTLLKPGAEKLCMTFRMAPAYEVDERLLEHGHREYRVLVTLTGIPSKTFIGQGVGCCSTMEGKYRFRTNAAEATDKPVPRSYWDVRAEDPAKAQELIGGRGYSVKKVEGKGWMIAKGGEKAEHDNPADHYNTVLKMAKKRALVDAVLTTTAASDIFTQDLEDITANLALAGTAENTPVSTSAPTHTSAPAPARAERKALAAPVVEAQVVPVEIDPWETVIHFGKNKGKTFRELTEAQREWYFDTWPKDKAKETRPLSPQDVAMLDAIKRMAPIPAVDNPTANNDDQHAAALERLGKLLCDSDVGDEELVSYLREHAKRPSGKHVVQATQELHQLGLATLGWLADSWEKTHLPTIRNLRPTPLN